MWLVFAFLGPLSWAVSTHIDKYLVDRYFPESDTAVLMVFTALMGVVALPVIWAFHPGIFEPSPRAIAVMTVSGVMYIGSMLFYLRAIQSEEASVVAPLFQATTIFTFVLGWAMLGETLSWRAGAGAVLIVAGVLSLGSGFRMQRMKPRVVIGMLICTFILALANVLFKFYAVQDDFWTTTFWTFVGEAIFGAGILAMPRYRRQFFDLVHRYPGPLLGLNSANELVNLGGGLAVRYASMLAPVALVAAVASTTTLFVFVLGTALSAFAPGWSREDLSRRELMRKGIAAAIVTAGVLLAGS